MLAPVADNVVLLPAQIGDVPAATATGGAAFTPIVAVSVAVQPLMSVPVTVYIVVARGVAVTGVPVDALNVADGDHE